MDKKRIFLGIPLPEDIKNALTAIQNKNIYWLKWMDVANMHITLNFLGELNQEQIQRVGEIAGEILKKTVPIDLTLNKIVPRANMLWLVPSATAELFYLHAELKDKLRSERIGKSERRPYVPHVLLAKSKKSTRKISSHKRPVYREGSFHPLNFFVTRVNLYESHLTPIRATHEVIQSYPLGDNQT